MTITLTTDLLVDLGYEALTEREANELLRALYDAAETVVGAYFASQMSNEQLDTFERFIESDDVLALEWLEQKFPHYSEFVRKTFDDLQEHLRRTATEARAAYTRHAISEGPPHNDEHT